jgi:Ca2+-binding RTX toxin-like protein
VRNKRPDAKDLTAAVTEDGKAEVKLLATDVETPAVALIFTVTSLPTQGQLSTQSGAAVHVGDQFTGAPTLAYEPGAARDGAGNDSFDYIVTDSTGVAGALSDNANVAVTINKAVADGKVTVDSIGIVRVGGTSGNDNIVATRSGSKLLVKINGKTVSSNTALSNVKEIRAWGRGGNDKISVLLVDVPTLLHGGTGNDEIIGALGSNLIFGGSGNDKLLGGVRNDLLVGGAGTDTIIDALGDDVLVGGEVTNQLTDDFYRQVLQQWDNGQNQNNRFKQSLTNDGAIDSLFDSLGDDWFVVGNGDLNVDLNPFDSDLLTKV